MDHKRREERIEKNWRLFRLTSLIATAVFLICMIAIDASFGFKSLQLNIMLVLLAACLFALTKLDFWIHQLTKRIRRRRQ